MVKNKMIKINFKFIIVIAILNLCGFSFAEDMCSDNVDMLGLPTFTENLQHPEDWFSAPVIKTSQDTIERNSFVEVWIALSGWGFPPFKWEIKGSGFHFDDISGPLYEETKTTSTRLKLWADGTACGSAEITVTDSTGENDTGFVRSRAGYWDFKGKYCGLPGKVYCSSFDGYFDVATYVLIKGNKKQTQQTKIIQNHRIHPSQGHCQWCEDVYDANPCGTLPATVDWDNCIDGDHVVPGMTFCCSTNYYWCDPENKCRSELSNCDEGDNHWMAHEETACIWDRGGIYGVRLEYFEWECN